MKVDKEQKKVCDTCGGTGDIGFFQGESRFMLTREECPACCGLGHILLDDKTETTDNSDTDCGIDIK